MTGTLIEQEHNGRFRVVHDRDSCLFISNALPTRAAAEAYAAALVVFADEIELDRKAHR